MSLPLMLRAPNKASRRSSCFSFLKRVIYPTLISLVSKVRMGVKVRRFGSSSWGEQVSLGRWQLPVVPAAVILRKNRAQPHIWSKAADMVLSLLHSGTELHSQFIESFHIHLFTVLLEAGQGTCSHLNFQVGETLKCSVWEYNLFQREHSLIDFAKKKNNNTKYKNLHVFRKVTRNI